MYINLLLAFIIFFPVSTLASGSTPVQDSERTAVFHLNDQEMENILEKGESDLKKIKVTVRHQEQKRHVQNTEKSYQKAVVLYRQKRKAQSRQTLVNVEDSMAEYKATLKYIRMIDDQAVQKFKLEERRVKQIKEGPVAINLSKEASKLYAQTVYLGEDKDMVALRKKLAKVAELMKELKQKKENKSEKAAVELDTQQGLDQIAQKADRFDQEVAKLIQAGDYTGARAKYNEFQNTMTDELKNVRASVVSRKVVFDGEKNKGGVLEENGYKRLEGDYFRHGIELYRARNYQAARIIFSELARNGNGRARAYMEKTDRLIEAENLKRERGN